MTTTDQAILKQRSPHVDRPCPACCPSTAGHPWESVTHAGMARRFHERAISPASGVHVRHRPQRGDSQGRAVRAQSPESIGKEGCFCTNGAGGSSVLTPVSVCVYMDADEQSCDLAVWLMQAANYVDRRQTTPEVTR